MSRLVVLLSAAVLFAGCPTVETGAYTDQRFPVKGEVTVNGKPLESGSISFIATQEGQRPAGGPITNGKYDVPENLGPNAGKYRVEIRWTKPTGKKVKDSDTGEMIDVIAEGLPPRYHSQSILTATIEAGKTDFPFELVVD